VGLSSDYRKEYNTYGALRAEGVIDSDVRFFDQSWSYGIRFNNPVNQAEAMKQIRIEPAVPLKSGGTYENATDFISLHSWQIRPGSAYTVTVNSALKDSYGNAMRERQSFSFSMPDRRPGLWMEGGFHLLERNHSKTIPLTIEGLQGYRTEIFRYNIEDLQGSLEKWDYGFTDGSAEQAENRTTGFSRNGAGVITHSLAGYMASSKNGWFALRITNPTVNWQGKTVQQSQSAIIQATDLGMSVKEYPEGYHAYVHSVSKGAPVEGVTLTEYDAGGRISGCVTDRSGHCSVERTLDKSVRNLLYVAESKEDRAYVHSGRHQLYAWSHGVSFNRNGYSNRLKGMLLFDRRLYRPGEMVNLKAFLALLTPKGSLPAGGKRVNLIIRDSRGEEMVKGSFETSAEGGIDHSFKLATDASTGHYSVSITSADSDEGVHETFQVEEFRPALFGVTISGVSDMMRGETKSAAVQGRYLFGAPMIDAPVSVALYREVYRPHFDHLTGFLFGEESEELYYGYGGGNIEYISSTSGKTDAAGSYPIPITAEALLKGLNQPQLNAYRIRLEATVRNTDEKTVTKLQEFTLYPELILPGIRIGNRYLNPKEPLKYDLIAVNRDGRTAPSALTVTIERIEWKTILTKGPGGSVQRDNTLSVKRVFSGDAQSGEAPVAGSFVPTEAGQYQITVSLKNGKSFAKSFFYVYGGGMTGYNFRSDDEITLMPDKNNYKPGEKAMILVQSPYSNATAIVTVERDRIYHQFTKALNGNMLPVEIPVTAEYLPNVFVSVILIRPRVAGQKNDAENSDPGRPLIKSGIVRLKVSPEQHRARLEIKSDRPDYGPGDTVTLRITGEPNAEIALSVADRGVLDLIGYDYPDPIRILFSDWPNAIRLLENISSVIRQITGSNKGDAPGGGGGEDAGGFAFDSEDVTRKNFRYTAYWNPGVQTDQSGSATVTFQLPDNLTTFRIMAISSAKGRYANFSSEFEVKKRVVVMPLLPRFIRPGDRLNAGAVVVNQGSADATFTLKIDSDWLVAEQKTKALPIKRGQSVEIVIPSVLNLKAFREAKESGRPLVAEGVIAVTSKAGSDSVRFKLPVKEAPPVEAFSISGFTDGAEEEAVRLPERSAIDPDYGGLSIELSSSALSGIGAGFDFFASNPYFCLEQRASAYLLSITSGRLLELYSKRPPEDNAYRFDTIRSLFIGELNGFQNPDGGFRAWKSGEGRSNPYLTAYVLRVLQNDRELNGAQPDSVIFKGAFEYLKGYLKNPGDLGYSYTLETYSMISLVFAEEGEDAASLQRFLLENAERLTVRAKANLALGLYISRKPRDAKQEPDIKMLLGMIRNSIETTTERIAYRDAAYGSFSNAYYTDGSVTASVLRLFMKIDREHPLIPFMVKSIIKEKGRTWSDSHSTGLTSLALYDYFRLYEGTDTNFHTSVTLSDKRIFDADFKGTTEGVLKKSIPMADLYRMLTAGAQHPFRFDKAKGKGRLYYRSTLEYTPALSRVDAKDAGIEIRREIFLPSDLKKPVPPDGFKRGEIYLNRLLVVISKPVMNFVIDHPLPSQFEAVNASFKTESFRLKAILDRAQSGSDEYGEDGEGYYYSFETPNYEYRDDRVVITQEYLPPGLHELYFMTRPLVHGDANAPPTRAFMMYEPEIYGRTSGQIYSVR
jgi:hypothetical protein